MIRASELIQRLENSASFNGNTTDELVVEFEIISDENDKITPNGIHEEYIYRHNGKTGAALQIIARPAGTKVKDNILVADQDRDEYILWSHAKRVNKTTNEEFQIEYIDMHAEGSGNERRHSYAVKTFPEYLHDVFKIHLAGNKTVQNETFNNLNARKQIEITMAARMGTMEYNEQHEEAN